MEFTQEELVQAGYKVIAAPLDDWRKFDEHEPIPGYFQFDWLSARHPDLYHKFALSTNGLMDELQKIVDLAGLQVLDCGAGTGRSTIGAARTAQHVTAVDRFDAVVSYGQAVTSRAGLKNVEHVHADNAILPLADNSMDACIAAWAILSYAEAYRVLKPGGYLIELGAAPGALCGEMTATLAGVFPGIILEVARPDLLAAACPDSDTLLPDETWNGLPVWPSTILHDFTYTADYGDPQEAAAIFGRLYGPAARCYLVDRQQQTMAWRLRIAASRVRK